LRFNRHICTSLFNNLLGKFGEIQEMLDSDNLIHETSINVK
ncbi:hypothetical protein LCGC14_2315530, partial [marine sediment metagenome]